MYIETKKKSQSVDVHTTTRDKISISSKKNYCRTPKFDDRLEQKNKFFPMSFALDVLVDCFKRRSQHQTGPRCVAN